MNQPHKGEQREVGAGVTCAPEIRSASFGCDGQLSDGLPQPPGSPPTRGVFTELSQVGQLETPFKKNATQSFASAFRRKKKTYHRLKLAAVLFGNLFI